MSTSGEWLSKWGWYLHTVGYGAAIKKTEAGSQVTTQRGL